VVLRLERIINSQHNDVKEYYTLAKPFVPQCRRDVALIAGEHAPTTVHSNAYQMHQQIKKNIPNMAGGNSKDSTL
jgi:hypothetical protein